MLYFLFLIGEITKENESLESFSELSSYISNGAVLGFGTSDGGKMVAKGYEDRPGSEYYYVSYYEEYKRKAAISKIDENNLNKIASDMKIDYIKINNSLDIDKKLNEIKKLASSSQSNEKDLTAYSDIYYFFAVPLVILVGIDFFIKKKKM